MLVARRLVASFKKQGDRQLVPREDVSRLRGPARTGVSVVYGQTGSYPSCRPCRSIPAVWIYSLFRGLQNHLRPLLESPGEAIVPARETIRRIDAAYVGESVRKPSAGDERNSRASLRF